MGKQQTEMQALVADAIGLAADGNMEQLRGLILGDAFQHDFTEYLAAIAELVAAATLARDWIEERGYHLTDGAGGANLRQALSTLSEGC